MLRYVVNSVGFEFYCTDAFFGFLGVVGLGGSVFFFNKIRRKLGSFDSIVVKSLLSIL